MLCLTLSFHLPHVQWREVHVQQLQAGTSYMKLRVRTQSSSTSIFVDFFCTSTSSSLSSPPLVALKGRAPLQDLVIRGGNGGASPWPELNGRRGKRGQLAPRAATRSGLQPPPCSSRAWWAEPGSRGGGRAWKQQPISKAGGTLPWKSP